MSLKKFKTMDGNEAAAYISYAFTEVATISPITPSSPMADHVDEWAAAGMKNIFGQPVKLMELQAESGACGAMHGALETGSLATTYTASQGLLLMIPPMYRIAGSMLPGVMHVSARTVSTHGLSTFGDHSDVMGCRQTGFAQLASSSVQECMDLGAVAHLAAIKGSIPFQHFFEGFRTSHEIQKIEVLDYDDMSRLVDWDAVRRFKARALNSEHPTVRNTVQNPDTFFQHREACNGAYDRLPAIVEEYMKAVSDLTGRDYQLFNYYGAPDADRVVIAMGSVCGTLGEVIDYLNAQGEKVGMIQVHLYRPFSVSHFLAKLPDTVQTVSVLDRTKEPGAIGEPLYEDVCTALAEAGRSGIKVLAGRYGLSSKDTTPGQFIAVYDNLKLENPKNSFTIGIEDDVTFTSLPYEEIALDYPGQVSCKIWGLGGDGTVGANKNAISTIGLVANKYAQAYFSYDSMKSGGLTQSHLRFGDEPIRSTYLVSSADFVAVHAPTYVNKYDTTEDLKDGGIFLLNCPWSAEELETRLPGKMKRDLARKHANFYIIDAAKLAVQVGLGEKRTNNILQAAFFALTKVIPLDMAVEDMKKNNYNSYFKKAGQKIVDLNDKAVDLGISAAVKVEIPASWADAPDTPMAEPKNASAFVRDIVLPMDRQQGDKLPVSVFQKHGALDGTWENGTSAFSKRGVATKVPKWNAESCIQCNRCAMCCPHAAIRPVLLAEEEKAQVPASFETVPAKGLGKDAPAYSFRMQVSPYDCLGCGVCLTACPAKGALEMVPFETQREQQPNFDNYAMNEKLLKKDIISDKSVKTAQFAKPYFQFSAACAGCAETTYIKLVTQLFGSRMYVANASGCSSAYGGAMPMTPYSCDSRGFGPCWEQSLFEDNAEFAYGFLRAHGSIHGEVELRLKALKEKGVAVSEIGEYLAKWQDPAVTREVSDALIAALEKAEPTEEGAFVLQNKEYLTKKSVWAFGGDGWAYDIGFGGIDHVLAQNRDINMLVMDTEVYSNTGGQSSKATPTAAVAKFAAGGKEVKKKDLGAIAMSYGYIYVAQVAMGYDQAQTLKAIREAESYPGPAIVIAYCPCLEHGIKAGMSCTQEEMKKAVECGYWHLYRYDPRRIAEGKNPFQLDSPAPDTDKLMDFLMGENRFASLKNNFPERADALYQKEIADVKARYQKYRKMAED